jgi:hypothetical protein
MEAGLSKTLLTWEDLIALMDAEAPKPGPRGPLQEARGSMRRNSVILATAASFAFTGAFGQNETERTSAKAAEGAYVEALVKSGFDREAAVGIVSKAKLLLRQTLFATVLDARIGSKDCRGNSN